MNTTTEQEPSWDSRDHRNCERASYLLQNQVLKNSCDRCRGTGNDERRIRSQQI